MNHGNADPGSRRCLQDLRLCSDKIFPLGNIPICRIDFLKREKRQMDRPNLHLMLFRSLFEIRKPIQNSADLFYAAGCKLHVPDPCRLKFRHTGFGEVLRMNGNRYRSFHTLTPF